MNKQRHLGMALGFGTEHDKMDKVMEEVKKAIAQKTEWTPVNEGLPKVSDCYAVTIKNGSELRTSACFFERPNIWHNDIRINRKRNCLTNVVAWAPLPKPYNPESEE